MRSKLGKFLESLRVRKNLSIERLAFRLEGTGLKIKDFEANPELLPADQLATYLAAVDITLDEYKDFCEISILEFGKKASRHLNMKTLNAITKAKSDRGVLNAREFSKITQHSRALRRKA